MQNYCFGVANYNGEYTDVSITERGAKTYATRHGYKDVYKRNVNHYYITHIATKQGKQWVNVE